MNPCRAGFVAFPGLLSAAAGFSPCFVSSCLGSAAFGRPAALAWASSDAGIFAALVEALSSWRIRASSRAGAWAALSSMDASEASEPVDLTDVFFSIFFVTVVRSFSPGVRLEDRTVAAGTAAGWVCFCAFVSPWSDASSIDEFDWAGACFDAGASRAAAPDVSDFARDEDSVSGLGLLLRVRVSATFFAAEPALPSVWASGILAVFLITGAAFFVRAAAFAETAEVLSPCDAPIPG
uniref:Uncharacterized protein n=1 Tax=Methylocapsa acidiphila TaxID=133552 RepID=Q2VNM7_METAI|nr:hypothetical protein orf42 [Methylocapsa acidiphila]